MKIEIVFPYFLKRVEKKGKIGPTGARCLGWTGIEIRRRRKGIRSISVLRILRRWDSERL